MVLQDIKFSMPFSVSGPPTTTVEDLQDLLEFEKSNPGQVGTWQKFYLIVQLRGSYSIVIIMN